ncbi:MAG TPA: Arc family DNA-binding protein [Anaerolineales bacterium]|nr:Arc family DNA-binding protein [Anaerolineales bacterium]
MATITVKNIPDDLYEQLKRSAEANRRSLNSEILVCIERAVQAHKVHPTEVLAEARRLREITSAYVIAEDEFNRAKAAGRP